MKTENQLIGILYAVAAAVFFSLGGLFSKIIPWSAMSIQAARSFFALLALLTFMRVEHHPFHLNWTVFLGGIMLSAMGTGYILANKLTTAANAIVLQYMEPIWVMILMRIVWKKRSGKAAVAAMCLSLVGIIFFFLDGLESGNMLGNLIAILSGMAYAALFVIKQSEQADMESSMVLGFLISMGICGWWIPKETVFTARIWILMAVFGIVQYCLPYCCLFRSLDRVNPVTASIICMLEPILNPILVAVFYGELVGPLSLIGGVIVVGSVTFYSVLEARKK